LNYQSIVFYIQKKIIDNIKYILMINWIIITVIMKTCKYNVLKHIVYILMYNPHCKI